MAAVGQLEAQEQSGHTKREPERVPHAGDSRDQGLGCPRPQGEALGGRLRQPGPDATFRNLLPPSAQGLHLPLTDLPQTPSFPLYFYSSSVFISFFLWCIMAIVPCNCSSEEVVSLGKMCFPPHGVHRGLWLCKKKEAEMGKNCFGPCLMATNPVCCSSVVL